MSSFRHAAQTGALALAAISATGCASMVNGRRQPVTINSTPDGAYVVLEGNQVGKTPWTGEVPRQSSLQITLAKEGYNAQVIALDGSLSGWFWANACCGGPTGSTTDGLSGGAYMYAPGAYHAALEPRTPAAAQGQAPSQPAGDRDARIKRFVLIYYKDLGQEISQQKGERLETLRGLMGLDGMDAAAFAGRIRGDYASAESADALAERLILMAR